MTQENNPQELESLESLKTSLEAQNAKVSACTGWKAVSSEFIIGNFVTERPVPVTDDDLKKKIFNMFCTDVDPLSAEGLAERFPSFPPEWYDLMAKASKDRFDVIEEVVPLEKRVTTTQGKFKISFD